jgi:hypothetical protein
MADDDCYELLADGEATGVVELPVEWIRDDAPYFMMDRFASLRPYTPPRAGHEGVWFATHAQIVEHILAELRA